MDERVVRLLCVSDTHNAWDNVDKAALLAGSCDAVIVTGDLALYDDEKKLPAGEMEAEHDMDAVLRRLEHGHDRPVFFIPGNHDAPSSLREPGKRRLGSRAVTVHDQARMQLAEGLVLCGLGGSVPAYQNGYIVWAGFPFTEHVFGERLAAVWQRCASSAAPGEQVVLLTHVGPAEVSTTVSLHNPKAAIDSGSSSLRRLLSSSDVQDRVVLNIHGHTHDASGCARVGAVTVLNPGALLEARLAVVEMRRGANGRWAVRSVDMRNSL